MSGLISVSHSTALQNGETALVKACSGGYATAVKLLLNAEANMAVVNMVSPDAHTMDMYECLRALWFINLKYFYSHPLWTVITLSYPSLESRVSYLCFVPWQNGWPLLSVVVRQLFRPDITIIDILIEAGADPDAKDTVSRIQRAGRKKWSI